MRLHLLIRVAIGGLVLASAGGCTVRDKPNFLIAPQINHMMFSKAQESQSASSVIPGGRTLLTPPEGTIRRVEGPLQGSDGKTRLDFMPIHYEVSEEGAVAGGFVDDKGGAKLTEFATAQAKKAGVELVNPYQGSDDPVVLARAEMVYLTFCTPCHGKTGMGDGPVSKRGMPGFPLAPKDAPPVGYADGHIYHIVSYGRGMMSTYATQISPDDRWKAIRWVRKLQKDAAAGGQGG
jgi:mono/diheme cytochrome c family protein